MIWWQKFSSDSQWHQISSDPTPASKFHSSGLRSESHSLGSGKPLPLSHLLHAEGPSAAFSSCVLPREVVSYIKQVS